MNIKQIFAPADMSEGTPWKKILIFTIPLLIGNVAQQLYNTVDSIVVGKYVGDNALAAVGSASPIFNFLLVLFVGISVGAGIMVAQYFGAKAEDELAKTIGDCITLTAIATIFLMVTMIFLIRPILELLNTPESIIGWCHSYLTILLMGIGGLAYYNILCGILRGLGDSLSALIYLLIATVINIVLDVYFVAGLSMGVAGVALATSIAQTISAILCMIKLLRLKNFYNLKKTDFILDKDISFTLIRLGLPSGITQAIFSIAMILVQSLTNSFGEMVIAANVIIMRVDGFAMMPNMSFGNAMTTYAGQNVGANRYDRVYEGAKQGCLLALAVSTSVTLIILLFGHTLMYAFTDTKELVEMSMHYMRILALGYIVIAVYQCLAGTMRGAGDTMTQMYISLFCNVLFRVPLAYILVHFTKSEALPNGAPESVFISLLVCWLLLTIMAIVAYRRGKWKDKAIS